MPRFFLDLHDGTHLIKDREGSDLPDLAAARAQAARIMTRIAQGMADGPSRQDYVLAVRAEDGAVLLRMRMSFESDCSE